MNTVRELFPALDGRTYLNTAAEGLIGSPQAAAMARYAADKSLGERGRAACAVVEERCRERAARLLGASPDEIAFVASTARGIDAVIQSVDWRRGDNIVLSDLEYPTNAYAAIKLQERGVEMRVVPATGGAIALEDLADRLDARTRVVVASLVSFKSGFRYDLDALARVVHDAGAWLLVDGVQALGATPVDATPADFVVGATYKWLLGSHGVAVLFVNRRLHGRIAPAYVGWRGVVDIFTPDRFSSYALHPDARRFEEGMPNYLGLYVLDSALELLGEIGVDGVAEHDSRLAGRLIDGYARLGVEPLTPADPAQRAGIVAIEHANCADIARLLAEQDIFVWGKDGRVRAATHLYNTEADVDRYLDAVEPLL